MTKRILTLLFVVVIGVPVTAAQAAPDQEAMFQDDNLLIYTSDGQREANLDTLKGLGVDRIRVTVLWAAIAPEPRSRARPAVANVNTRAPFTAHDPATYSDGIWRNYDQLIKGARARGIGVNLNVTGPSPLWANGAPPRSDVAETFEPSPVEFNAFVRAVGRRYDGTYPDPAGGTLPRVDYWSIWNEPNISGWLTPTWQRGEGVWYERSASLYRELVGQAWSALFATGHGTSTDTILIGEGAPAGNDSKNVKRQMTPLTFYRALYCVDARQRRLTGRRARLLGCGSSASAFKRANPALFSATGFAHHPYQLLLPPAIKPRDRRHVTIGSLERLTGMLDATMRTYRSRTRFPLYLTEFGYQTPPDRFGVPLRFQGQFLNQAEFIAHRNRRVRSTSQFLLNDDGEPIGLTFQSGLRTNAGAAKPSLAAYRLPLWVRGRGSARRVWGVARPATGRTSVQVQFRRAGTGTWRTVRTLRTRGPRQVFAGTVRLRGRGDLRVRWNGFSSRTERIF